MTSLRHTLWAAGPKATAEVLEWSKSQPPALSLSLDPGDVLIPAPMRKGERALFASFLLDLAEAATQLAEQLDPDGMPAPPESTADHIGRHVMVRDHGDAGAGQL
jgi:hypothetical protein